MLYSFMTQKVKRGSQNVGREIVEVKNSYHWKEKGIY